MSWRALLPVLLLLLPLPLRAEVTLRMEPPALYGWFIGDMLEQRIHISLPEGVKVQEASLPRPRAVDYWLDLGEVRQSQNGRELVLELHWQNFYAAVEPDRRHVPSSRVRLSNGETLELPGFDFVTAPLRPLTASLGPDQMLPDPDYHLIDPRPKWIGAIISGFLLILASFGMAWQQAWFPFHQRPKRPFTHALRQIGRLSDPAAQRKCLHQALDQSYGKVLITPELPDFVVRQPAFLPLAERLEQFFAASDAALFGTKEQISANVPALAKALSDIERGRG